MPPCNREQSGGSSEAAVTAERARVRDPRPRVVVCEGCLNGPSASALEDARWEVVLCASCEAVLEAVVARRPDVVVYGLSAGGPDELAMLRLLRHAARGTPIILVTSSEGLAAQRALREMNPIYIGVAPLERGELLGALESALRMPARPSGA